MFTIDPSRRHLRASGLVFAAPLALASLLAPLVGCGDDEAETPPPVPPVPQTMPAIPPAPATPPTPPSTPAGATGAADPADPPPQTDGVEVHVRAVQLMHPESRGAPMPPLVADTRNERDWIRDDDFQIAVQVEATNNTERLLSMPAFDANVRIQGSRGGVNCRPHRRDGRVTMGARLSDGPGNEWREDSGEEYFWRPGERVRFTMRARCGSLSILEVDPQTIVGAFQIVATSPFDMGAPVRIEVPLTLPGAAMVMQQVSLPDGSTGYASGNWVTHSDNGRVRRDHLASWGINAHTAQRTNVPAQTPQVNVRRNEWSLVSSEVTMTHYTQANVDTKGNRLVRVAATISIDTSAIEGRLQADVTSAQQALAAAQQTLAAAQQALTAARAGGDEGAIDQAEDAVEDADRAADRADDAVSSAQRSMERGLSSERSSMARYLSCDRLTLATNEGDRRARNSRAARDACSSLGDSGQAQVVWEFEIDRYEVPVALSFQLARDDYFVPIASQQLSSFDIH